MEDLGDQTAYLVLKTGTPVYSSDEEWVGDVTEILAVANDDIFDGLVMADGSERRYIQADLVNAIYERGVVLDIDSAACRQLPLPRT